MDSIRNAWYMLLRSIRKLPGALNRASVSAAVRWGRAAPGRLFETPAVTVKVRDGWCMRAGWAAPGECIFFDVVNWTEQPVRIDKMGVGVEEGKDVAIEPKLFHPPLPFEIGGRQRRVFSIAAGELVEQMGRNWIRLDIASVFVGGGDNALYRSKIPRRIREKLSEEYGGR